MVEVRIQISKMSLHGAGPGEDDEDDQQGGGGDDHVELQCEASGNTGKSGGQESNVKFD